MLKIFFSCYVEVQSECKKIFWKSIRIYNPEKNKAYSNISQRMPYYLEEIQEFIDIPYKYSDTITWTYQCYYYYLERCKHDCQYSRASTQTITYLSPPTANYLLPETLGAHTKNKKIIFKIMSIIYPPPSSPSFSH